MSDALPELATDADYRAMLAAAIEEMLRDLRAGDTWRAESIGRMAVLLQRHGPDSEQARDHMLRAHLEAMNLGSAQ